MTQTIRQWLPTSISALGVLVAGLVSLPLLYIVTLALSTRAAVWSRLWQTRIPELLSNTAWLAVGVSIGTLLIGASLAWIVVRYDFWGRRMWEWALVLPLTMPTYVLAYVYTYLLGTGGPEWGVYAVSTAVAVTMLVTGAFFFRRVERSFADIA